MKKFVTILVLPLFILHYCARAQAPLVSWQKCLGSPYLDWGQTMVPTTDGGSIAIGYVGGNGGDVSGFLGLQDYWVVKLDNSGATQWSVSLGGADQNIGESIRQTSDGGYIVAGEADSQQGSGNVTTVNNGGLDLWLVKLSSTGSILWEKEYGGQQNEYIGDVRQTPDGGFILAGSTQGGPGQIPGNHGGYDIWAVKLNSDGSMAWQQIIGGSSDDWGYGVQVAPDGYVVTGYTNSNDGNAVGNHGASDVLAAKLDLNGKIVWSKCLGGSDIDWGWGTEVAPDGSGYLFAGLTRSDDGQVVGNHSPGGWQDAWVVKLDVNGNLLWQHCYGGSYNEAAYSIHATSDGGYVLAGSAQSLDGDVSCMPSYIPQMGTQAGWVFKISATGTLLWNKVISGSYYDGENDAEEAPDGSILVCGYTALSDFPNYHHDITNTVGDVYVGKLFGQQVPQNFSLSLGQPPGNICSGATVTLTTNFNGPSSGVTWHWIKNGIDQGVNAGTYGSANFANGDLIYCQAVIADGDCGAPVTLTSNTIILSVSPVPAPAISIVSGAAIVCSGAPLAFTATVTGGSAAGAYEWLVNGSPADGVSGAGGPTYSSTTLNNGDTISCIYQDNSVCVVPGQIVSNAIIAQVAPSVDVSISIEASASSVCAGTIVNFTSTIAGGGGSPAYQWLVNGSSPSGAPGTSGVTGPGFSSATLTSGDLVSCQLTSSAACSSPAPATSNTIPVTVTPNLASNISVAYSPDTLCSDRTIVFTAAATGAGTAPFFQWQVNGVNAGGDSATFICDTLSGGDIISCAISDSVGCVIPSSASVSPVINPSPVVVPGQSYNLSGGQSLTLDLSPQGDIVTYRWSPATWLSNPDIADPVASPAATTTYTLVVETAEGCIAKGAVTVNVYTKLAIPNAFTPNGDGRNDIFYVMGGPAGCMIRDFSIFNRWGARVFQVQHVPANDPVFGWDGRMNGDQAPSGAYIYEILIGFADGTTQLFKGTVMLVR